MKFNTLGQRNKQNGTASALLQRLRSARRGITPLVRWTASVLLCAGLAACKDGQRPRDDVRVVENIKVEGVCFEDHVRQSAKYAGSIVHWHNVTKDKHSRFGSVMHFSTPEQVIEQLKDPYSYKPPFVISLPDVTEAQLSGSAMKVKGISQHHTGERSGPEYHATCSLSVVERIDGERVEKQQRQQK